MSVYNTIHNIVSVYNSVFDIVSVYIIPFLLHYHQIVNHKEVQEKDPKTFCQSLILQKLSDN